MAATADCIFSIFQDDEDKELGIVKMGIMKNRYLENKLQTKYHGALHSKITFIQ